MVHALFGTPATTAAAALSNSESRFAAPEAATSLALGLSAATTFTAPTGGKTPFRGAGGTATTTVSVDFLAPVITGLPEVLGCGKNFREETTFQADFPVTAARMAAAMSTVTKGLAPVTLTGGGATLI